MAEGKSASTRPVVKRRNAAIVTGMPAANVVEETTVDLVNDFEMARQQVLKPLDRPFLQRFGQQRVICVWTLAALVPLINLVPIWRILSKARKALRNQGIPATVFGASDETIKKLAEHVKAQR